HRQWQGGRRHAPRAGGCRPSLGGTLARLAVVFGRLNLARRHRHHDHPDRPRQARRQQVNQYTFIDAEYLSARDKRLTLKEWELLLRRSFDPDTWDQSGRVYHVCSMYLDHIAHFNQAGFYSAQMSTPTR